MRDKWFKNDLISLFIKKQYMLSVLFVLLFYIAHCCIDIEDRSLSGLYFNKIILSYLILFYERMKVKRTILCHSVLSVLAYLPLQNFCVFLSYYKLRGAILFSNLTMCRFYERMKVVYSPFAIQNDPYT
jgi:hypothetical protein